METFFHNFNLVSEKDLFFLDSYQLNVDNQLNFDIFIFCLLFEYYKELKKKSFI